MVRTYAEVLLGSGVGVRHESRHALKLHFNIFLYFENLIYKKLRIVVDSFTRDIFTHRHYELTLNCKEVLKI